MAIWILAMSALFTLAGTNLLNVQTAAFILVCLLWPTAAVTIKRLHDRGKSGLWALLMILAWMLLAGNWSVLPGVWQWVVGRFVPTLIIVMMFIDLGAFVGTQGENKFGKDTQDVRWKAEPDYQYCSAVMWPGRRRRCLVICRVSFNSCWVSRTICGFPHSITWLVSAFIGRPTASSRAPVSIRNGIRPVSEPAAVSRLTTV
jgi:uncharacterized membrane protein YhaH (DUF805 family)